MRLGGTSWPSSVDASQNLPLSDPAVQKSCMEHLHPWFQQVRFLSIWPLLLGLSGFAAESYFEGSPKSLIAPNMTVEVFIDSIGGAVERAGAVEDDPA